MLDVESCKILIVGSCISGEASRASSAILSRAHRSRRPFVLPMQERDLIAPNSSRRSSILMLTS